MLKFVIRKMLNKKWLMAALLIGNILLVAIAAGNPMYTNAALQRMLTNTFTEYVTANGKYPTMAYLLSNIHIGSGEDSKAIKEFKKEDELAAAMPGELGLTAKYIVKNIFLDEVVIAPERRRSDFQSENVRLGYLSGMEDHISIVSGSLYSDKINDGIIDVMVSQKAQIKLNLMLGEVLRLEEIYMDDGKTPYRVRIAGVFENSEADDHYWYKSPNDYSTDLMMPEKIFNKLFDRLYGLKYKTMGLWFVIMDYTCVTVDNAEYIYNKALDYVSYHEGLNNCSYNDYYRSILKQYIADAAKIKITLQILQIPIYALLAAFIFMVSGQILNMEQSEISVLKSRGAGKRQLISIYLIQSSLIAAVSLIAGLPLSMLICQILGSANAFLEFVSRQALEVKYNDQVFAFGLIAALCSMIAMVLPVFKYAKLSIVTQKQKKRRSDKPFFQRFYLDVVLLAVSLYGLYTFNGQKTALAQKVIEGQGLDPLLFLSSSLFIIGAGLVALRLIPAFVWLVYRLGKKAWKPQLYASFLWVLRTRNSQGYITAFLVITLAIGVFNAQTARTINTNEENRVLYAAGADLVMQEVWEDNRDEIDTVEELDTVPLVYTEPNYGKYQEIEGAASVTKVLYDTGAHCSCGKDNAYVPVTLMGINTKEFGETFEFKDGLLPQHWYNYLNAISQNPMAVLVSSNMKENIGLSLGDTISYRDRDGNSARGIIYGFVDYWPTFNPTIITKGDDGVYHETDNYLVVANFSYYQSQCGLTPYQVWIKAEDDTAFIYDFAAKTGTKFTFFRDKSAELIDLKNDPIFQGTNGILTLGFTIVLILCCVGFLIYWILSIKSRTLLLGIFRAMGMYMREIIAMLINEQIFISGLSIAMGIGIGLLASRLYIPLVQIAYSSIDTVIPLEIISQPSDMARLLTVVAVMVVLCMIILGMLISRIKISQALKLGED
jgi:putative ABC transport system permease protein